MDDELAKKRKLDSDDEVAALVVSSINRDQLIETSNWNASLEKSKLSHPTTVLSGHEGAIYSISFSPSGNNLLSASQDGKLYLWELAGECKNYNVLHGHKNAVLEAKWLTDTFIISCSADKSVALWDANKGTRIRKYTDHTAIVNCCSVCSPNYGSTVNIDPYLFITGSDDCYLNVFDSRSKQVVTYVEAEYPILSSCLSFDGLSAYFGCVDNNIYRWDLRMESADPELAMTLGGHVDSVCGLSLSPDNKYLLSNAFDGRLYQWDVKPFVVDENQRCIKEFSYNQGVLSQSNHQNSEKSLIRCAWSPDQELVATGGNDRMVKIWNATTGALQYYLPGHKGAVNDVIFHQTSKMIASCGTDKIIYIGELD